MCPEDGNSTRFNKLSFSQSAFFLSVFLCNEEAAVASPQNVCSPSNYNPIKKKKKVYENNNGNFTDPSLKQCLPYGKAGVGVLNCGREGRVERERKKKEEKLRLTLAQDVRVYR